MGVGAFLEPLVVVALLFGGTWINRETDVARSYSRCSSASYSPITQEDDSTCEPRDVLGPRPNNPRKKTFVPDLALSPSLLTDTEARWRTRDIGLGRWRMEVKTPNTAVFRNRLLSRLLHNFPFLVECWYWALVYWTYQLGRAFTAVTLEEETVDVARKHALQLIEAEKRLLMFYEPDIQQIFLAHPMAMTWINRLYSFIHIPGTIAFLVWLYYHTNTRDRVHGSWQPRSTTSKPQLKDPGFYQSRRRTLAVCNLLAFAVFTLWPCMPPRLLSDKSVKGPVGDLARSYGFVDTVHGSEGARSVWTNNRFCNQYAAMPSLHFGYSLLIGFTIMTIPLQCQDLPSSLSLTANRGMSTVGSKTQTIPWRRLLCLTLGFLYPLLILIAIIATANHFILDAVAGAIVCGLGWWGNTILLNLLPLEDYFFRALRIHKPEPSAVWDSDREYDDPREGLAGPAVSNR